MKEPYLLAAHAALPAGTDIYETYKYVTLVAEVELDTGLIVRIGVPVYCKLSENFVAKIIEGKSLDQIDSIISEIDERMHTLSKRALITAIQGVYNRYTVLKKKMNLSQKINNEKYKSS